MIKGWIIVLPLTLYCEQTFDYAVTLDSRSQIGNQLPIHLKIFPIHPSLRDRFPRQ